MYNTLLFILLSLLFIDLSPHISQYISSLKQFDFLWQDDLTTAHSTFTATNPSPQEWKERVMNLVKIEKEVKYIYMCYTIWTELINEFQHVRVLIHVTN